MNTFKVKTNLKHDGTFYVKGDEVGLGEKDAEQLLSDGVVTDLDDNEVDETSKGLQPAVNNVKRKGGEVDGKRTVEKGKVEKSKKDDSDSESNKDSGDDKGPGDGKGSGDKKDSKNDKGPGSDDDSGKDL